MMWWHFVVVVNCNPVASQKELLDGLHEKREKSKRPPPKAIIVLKMKT